MRTLRRKELSKIAKSREKAFWLMMKSADSGKSCYS